jgi:hypothetical protein
MKTFQIIIALVLTLLIFGVVGIKAQTAVVGVQSLHMQMGFYEMATTGPLKLSPVPGGMVGFTTCVRSSQDGPTWYVGIMGMYGKSESKKLWGGDVYAHLFLSPPHDGDHKVRIFFPMGANLTEEKMIEVETAVVNNDWNAIGKIATGIGFYWTAMKNCAFYMAVKGEQGADHTTIHIGAGASFSVM